MNRSLFIVFEGLDRAGKSTQVAMLNEYLSLKYPCNILKFPNRQTTLGKLIDSYLKAEVDVSDQSIHLLFTANRWEIVPRMQQLLKNNEIIICDRYSYSGIAYSAAKENMDFQWCKIVESGLPKPDIVFFMDVATSEISTRQGFGDEIYEKLDFQVTYSL